VKWDSWNAGTGANQRITDWLWDHPEAGRTPRPFAKSANARALLVTLNVVAVIVGWRFGLLAMLLVLVVLGIASWRLEFHPGWPSADRPSSTEREA
jgi:hypothetical protein